MSHKDKICKTALASHIEECHEQCTYTPLVVSKSILTAVPKHQGVKAILESEMEEKLQNESRELDTTFGKLKKSIQSNLSKAIRKSKDEFSEELNEAEALDTDVLKLVDDHVDKLKQDTILAKKEEFLNSSELSEEFSNPELAIERREAAVVGDFDIDKEVIDIQPIPLSRMCEYDGLGIFTKDSICQRIEGKTYSPCGEEITLLPGESIKESNVLKSSTVDKETNEETIEERFTDKNSLEESETFKESYEERLKKETDIKYSRESSLKADIGFKLGKIKIGFGGSSSSSASIGFSKLMEEISKNSFENTRKRFSEVFRSYSKSRSNSSSRTVSFSKELKYTRNWKNTSDQPEIYIKRASFCKTSVLHRRHNVQLAWSGCIENPAKDLCRPDNLETKYSSEIQAIRDKWNQQSPPGDFGNRPSGKKMCTNVHSANNSIFNTGTPDFTQPFQATIPNGWSYEANSASISIIEHSTQVDTKRILQQPNGGDTGGVSFLAQVILKNRGFKVEKVKFKVCFNIIPEAAATWDTRVAQWRKEQAQKEIDQFLAEKLESLNEFLLSDQARASIERSIMEKYFGVQNADDCCHLISRLRKLFDFDHICYTLLPSWNDAGEGCQRSNPVTLYTAKCLHFYVPMHEGRELEAVRLLVSINAIPWNGNLASQIIAYISQIQNLRATVYNRVFDPTGWDVKLDQPNSYELTPYDAAGPNWSADFESGLNYELLGAFTMNIPCGERIEKRPLLCE